MHMDFFQKCAVVSLKTYEEGGIGKKMATRNDAIIGQSAIGFNNTIPVGATCRLVILLWCTHSVVPYSHIQASKRFQIGPIIPINPHSSGKKADYAGLAGFLAGVTFVEAAGGAPRLHGANHAN